MSIYVQGNHHSKFTIEKGLNKNDGFLRFEIGE